MKNFHLVSFLISAYNEERFIQECIDSCLNQTYHHIEIIIVNDGSTDATSKIINLKYNKQPKVKIVNLNKNIGKVNGFNLAFEASQGEYIALMGADDTCYPHRIEESLRYSDEKDCFVCSDLDKINSIGTIIESKIIKTQYGNLRPEDFSTKQLIENPKVYGGTIFLSRKLAHKIFPLNTNLSHEDWYIPIQASLNSEIKYIDKPLIAYRIHSKNSSANTSKLIYNFPKWFYLNTRDIEYYKNLIRLVKKFSIETDIDEINFKLAKSLLLKMDDKLNVYLKYLPQIKGNRRKLLFSLHLFPNLLYILAMLSRLKKNFIHKFYKIQRLKQ